MKVKLSWNYPEGFEGFIAGETEDLNLTASVSVDDTTLQGKAYKAWAKAYPLPGLLRPASEKR
ncbi:MAG: hypothetical protein K6F53_06405 [Lachnospiraceae bacterium]|nr:hypothetical protein [Lachnospiraceae bacterium]